MKPEPLLIIDEKSSIPKTEESATCLEPASLQKMLGVARGSCKNLTEDYTGHCPTKIMATDTGVDTSVPLMPLWTLWTMWTLVYQQSTMMLIGHVIVASECHDSDWTRDAACA